MSSIRRRLNIWLISGSILLWLAAGVGVYFAARQGLVKSLDAELAIDSRIARVARLAARGNDRPPNERGESRSPERGPSLDELGSDVFFQIWNPAGELTAKSANLGTSEIDFPTGEVRLDPTFKTIKMPDGRELRTMTLRVPGGGPGKGRRPNRRGDSGTIAVLAKETTQLRETLSSLLGGIVMVGFGVIAAATLLVHFVVALVLKPLQSLARQTREVDAESLNARFDATGSPSELQPVYNHLNDLISRLERSFDRERRFNSDLAHEMRTPVAELKMLNEVALKWEDQAGNKVHQSSLEIADQLDATIESLLALARVESREFAPNLVEVNLEDLIETNWSGFAENAATKNLEIQFDFPDPSATLLADAALLNHIVTNLFSNAVAYSPPGGLIKVSTNDNVLTVSNATSDLAESDLEHLFERYWRSDTSRTGSGHTGLGLSLARACTEACHLHLKASLADQRITLKLSAENSTAHGLHTVHA